MWLGQEAIDAARMKQPGTTKTSQAKPSHTMHCTHVFEEGDLEEVVLHVAVDDASDRCQVEAAGRLVLLDPAARQLLVPLPVQLVFAGRKRKNGLGQGQASECEGIDQSHPSSHLEQRRPERRHDDGSVHHRVQVFVLAPWLLLFLLLSHPSNRRGRPVTTQAAARGLLLGQPVHARDPDQVALALGAQDEALLPRASVQARLHDVDLHLPVPDDQQLAGAHRHARLRDQRLDAEERGKVRQVRLGEDLAQGRRLEHAHFQLEALPAAAAAAHGRRGAAAVGRHHAGAVSHSVCVRECWWN